MYGPFPIAYYWNEGQDTPQALMYGPFPIAYYWNEGQDTQNLL